MYLVTKSTVKARFFDFVTDAILTASKQFRVINFRTALFVTEFVKTQCLSADHNPELRCAICIGVKRFALVLHLNCTTLSPSRSSNFFHIYYYVDEERYFLAGLSG